MEHPPSQYIVLDRDGVINEDSDTYIKHPDEWLPIPGSLEAIAELNRSGYRVVVVTNQSGIARGLFDAKTLSEIHDKMRYLTEIHGGTIESIYFCPHGPDDQCLCRKPKPGLLKTFARNKKVALDGIPVIGDSWRDIQAGWSVGGRPILVKTGNGARTLAAHSNINVPVFDNLYEASQFILSGQ